MAQLIIAMENSQLTEALQTLSKEEFREFGKFLRSPFFNNRSEVIRLYEFLKLYYPMFKSSDISKEKIYSSVYPGKKFNDILFRKVISLLVNQFQDYLYYRNAKNHTTEKDVRLLELLREKKLFGLFSKKEKKINENFNSAKHDFSLYELKFKAAASLNGVMLIKNEKEMLKVFQKEHDEFTAYFLSFLLLQYIRLSEWSRIYNHKYDIRLFEEVISYLEKNRFEDHPLIPLYFNMLMLIKTGEDKYFEQLNLYRIMFSDKVEDINNYNIALVLIQHCYKKIQQGFNDYRIKIFELTKFIIENDLIPPGYIEQYFFTNAVRYTASLKELDWCREFIGNFAERLDPDIKDEIINYSYSMIEFHKGDFESSLRYLSAINIESANMKYDIKNIQAMNLYELGYFEQLLQHIDSYKHFIARDEKRTDEFKDNNKKFLNFTIQLLKFNGFGKKEEISFYSNELIKSGYFSNKEWLTEKIDEIKKGAN